MNRYFTNRHGAVRRLTAIKREGTEALGATVVGRQKDGTEVRGLEQILRHLRVGRIACFPCGNSFDADIVFVS
ncbi:hypothetical protein AWB74_06071 [Caballeronia arvi]|uniref:Uncharacterized protein n=1 Tax=Caballeronia arvi TaxID=1777135 RepID=A0A158KL98_9BURK|nr:hypothetical protein [Caballeronia arvi]SAL81844.1 hypothetical protein AWB74_06071 [Caballeronia arvi]